MNQKTINSTRLFKTLLILISVSCLAGLLLVGGFFFSLVYQPQWFLSLTPKFTPYTLTAEEFSLHPTRLQVFTKNLVIRNQQDQEVARIGDMYISTTWSTLLNPPNIRVFGSINNATVNIQHLEKVSDSEKNDASQSSRIDISQQLQNIDVSLHNITLHLDKNTSIHLQEVSRLTDLTASEQGLTLTASYRKAEQSVAIGGRFIVSTENSIPTFTLQLAPLNVSTLIDANSTENATTSPTQTEATIDWRPIKPWLPIAFRVSSEKVSLPQGTINELNSHVVLTETKGAVTLQQKHKATLDLLVGEQLPLNDTLAIMSEVQLLNEQTQGADISGKTVITLGENAITVDGKLNLNHLAGNQFSLNTHIKEIEPYLSHHPGLRKNIVPFLPFIVDTQVNLSDHKIALNDLKMTANQSDINGDISIQHNNLSTFSDIQFDLKSKQLLVTHASNDTNKKSPSSKKIDASSSPFNQQTLDVAWLNTMAINGSWLIDQLVYNGHTLFKNSLNTITTKDKKLTIKSAINDIAEGTVAFAVTAEKIDDATLSMSIESSVNDISLEALHLIPKEELSGTKVSSSITLSAKGDSTQALAENLQGDLLIEGGDGVIANNTFEIIGSDLLLTLVNTINPFYKDSKNTELECVVVKSTINNGKMLFDDSIAIQTSKMIIVGDGEADIGKNTLNIGINPQARSGLGVDIASLAKFVAIQGTLTEPTIGVSGKGALESALHIGAAVSTGGVSLLANKLVDKATGDDPCVIAKNAFTQ